MEKITWDNIGQIEPFLMTRGNILDFTTNPVFLVRRKYLYEIYEDVLFIFRKGSFYHAKYFFLGVGFNICTMFHYVQARYWKEDLIKLGPNPPFPLFDMNLMGKKLEAKGLVRRGKIGEANSFWLTTKELVDNSLSLLRENPLFFFKEDSEFSIWHKKFNRR